MRDFKIKIEQVCIPEGCVLPASVATVNRMPNRCKNITLPQTSFAGGKYEKILVSLTLTNFRGIAKVRKFKAAEKVLDIFSAV